MYHREAAIVSHPSNNSRISYLQIESHLSQIEQRNKYSSHIFYYPRATEVDSIANFIGHRSKNQMQKLRSVLMRVVFRRSFFATSYRQLCPFSYSALDGRHYLAGDLLAVSLKVVDSPPPIPSIRPSNPAGFGPSSDLPLHPTHAECTVVSFVRIASESSDADAG